MEPAVDVYHLAKYPRELQRELVAVYVVVREVHEVVNAPALDILHHENAFPRLLYLSYRVAKC